MESDIEQHLPTFIANCELLINLFKTYINILNRVTETKQIPPEKITHIKNVFKEYSENYDKVLLLKEDDVEGLRALATKLTTLMIDFTTSNRELELLFKVTVPDGSNTEN